MTLVAQKSRSLTKPKSSHPLTTPPSLRSVNTSIIEETMGIQCMSANLIRTDVHPNTVVATDTATASCHLILVTDTHALCMTNSHCFLVRDTRNTTIAVC